MSLTLALPASAGAAQATTGSGQAGGAGANAGDALGLFGQLMAMLSADASADGQADAAPGPVDFKALAKDLKAGVMDALKAQGHGNSKKGSDDAATTLTDLSAIIAALLAAAQQAQTQPAATQPTNDDAATASADGKAASPLAAQLEGLLANLTDKAGSAPAAPQPLAATDAPQVPLTGAPDPATLALAQTPQAETPKATDHPEPLTADAVAPPPATQASLAAVAQPAPPAAPRPPARPVAGTKSAGVQASAIRAADNSAVAAAENRPAGEPRLAAKDVVFKARTAPVDAAAIEGAPIKAPEEPLDDRPPAAPAAAGAGASVDPAIQLASPAEVRGSPETVAKLAAQIVKQLDAKTTRFEVGLDPIGLGRVDVKVEIGANGKMHAQMSFDNAAAASDLRGRSAQLRDALEQAGFDLRGGSLSFDVAGQNQGQRQQQQNGQPHFAGAASIFEAALNLGDTPITAPVWAKGAAASGVDIRI